MEFKEAKNAQLLKVMTQQIDSDALILSDMNIEDLGCPVVANFLS